MTTHRPHPGSSTPLERSDTPSFEELQARVLAEHGVRAESYLLGDPSRPIHVLEAGSGDPLVFIHGGSCRSAAFVTGAT